VLFFALGIALSLGCVLGQRQQRCDRQALKRRAFEDIYFPLLPRVYDVGKALCTRCWRLCEVVADQCPECGASRLAANGDEPHDRPLIHLVQI